MTSLPLGTNGQVLIGATGAAPAFSTITSIGGSIIFTPGPNSLNMEAGASVPTTFNANIGSAIPLANVLDIFGTTQAAGSSPLITSASGNTVTIKAQRSQAIASTDVNKIGLSSYNSAQFSVDGNGFVTLAGGTSAPMLSLTPDASTAPGTSPTLPSGLGTITLTGVSTAAGTNPIRTNSLAANSIRIEVQKSQAIAATDATKIGLCNFNSAQFSVDANGFVSATGAVPIQFSGNSGTATPSAGNINILGASTAAGTSPVSSSASGSTVTLNVQKSQAIASTDATKIGLASFDSADFTVDANGFVSATTTGFIKTLTGNSGGAISPVANNINTVGTGSITISGSGSTLTTQLTGLTNHAIQIGAGTATLTQLGAGSTGQVLQTNTGADPTWSTATYPSTAGTSGNILKSDGTNFVSSSAASTGASLVLIATASPSNQTDVQFKSIGSYNIYFFVFRGVQGITNATDLWFQFSTTGGLSWDASNNLAGINYTSISTTTPHNINTTSAFTLTGPIDNARSGNGYGYIYHANAATFPYVVGQSSWLDTGLSTRAFGSFGGELGATGVNAFRFLMSSGNITASSISLYGVAAS